MLKGIRRIGWAACLCLSVFFLAAGFIRLEKGSDFFRSLTILSEEGFSSGILKAASGNGQDNEASEKEVPGEAGENDFTFTAWTECKGEFVSDGFSGRNCSGDIIAICGSSYCLLPFGKNLSSADREGCIIGSGMAEELFGSQMAEGQELVWRDRKWTVRGVVEEPADVLIVQAAGMADEMMFDRISVSLEGEDDRQMAGERFVSRYGIAAQPLRLDYLYSMAWFKEMVPDKWSDFSGWKQNLEEYGKGVEWARNVEKSAIEAAGLEYRRVGMWCIVLGTFCLGFVVWTIMKWYTIGVDADKGFAGKRYNNENKASHGN